MTVLIPSITILIACFIAFILFMRIRRRFKPAGHGTTNYDFAIERLLQLRQSGQISAEEFEAAKASVLARKEAEAQDASGRGFEVLPPRKPMIQGLEDRIAP